MKVFPLTLLSAIALLVGGVSYGAVGSEALSHDDDDLKLQWSAQFGLNAVAENNLFWNLADSPDLDFDSDTRWIEAYAKPGLGLKYLLSGGGEVYGKVSAVGSYTWGTDAFDAEDTGRISLEEAYLGYRVQLEEGLQLAVSAGPKELKLGTGMLVSNGGSNGFERGALKFGPRKAWRMVAEAQLATASLAGRLFYLAPNELASNKTENRLGGIDIRHTASRGGTLGMTYLHVVNSEAPYPQAAKGGEGPPLIASGARDGLNALNLYAESRPFKGEWENLFFGADVAYEWNDRIAMRAWGGRVRAGYTFADVAWKPVLTYHYQFFSGDDPNTSALERFDPLYYEGSPSAWSTGSKSSMVFINSNVMAHALSLRLTPTQRDAVTLRYAHIRASELRSPIQFGQATRVEYFDDVPSVFSGVSDAHLADDFFIEYSRIINPNTYLGAGYSLSLPGKGIESITENASNWTGGYINVVYNF